MLVYDSRWTSLLSIIEQFPYPSFSLHASFGLQLSEFKSALEIKLTYDGHNNDEAHLHFDGIWDHRRHRR